MRNLIVFQAEKPKFVDMKPLGISQLGRQGRYDDYDRDKEMHRSLARCV